MRPRFKKLPFVDDRIERSVERKLQQQSVQSSSNDLYHSMPKTEEEKKELLYCVEFGFMSSVFLASRGTRCTADSN